MTTFRIPGVERELSRIALGTAHLGSREKEPDAFAILDAYYEAGGRFFNTAHEYGDGLSEITLGKWIRSRGIRDEVTVTSKCGKDSRMPYPLTLHAKDLFQDIDETLSRLGYDHVDFYLLHDDDETVPVGEIVDAMAEMKRQGKILWYGCSNWRVERMKEAAAWADKRNLPRFAVDEIEMNLTRPNWKNGNVGPKWADESFIAYHRETGMPVGAYSPIANGILTKYLRDGDTRSWPDYFVLTYGNDFNYRAAKRVGRIAAETGFTPTQIQLAWLLARPFGFPCFPIVGARTVEQLKDSLGSAECVLSPDMVRYLSSDGE